MTTAEARERVLGARERAARRWAETPWHINAEVEGAWLRQGDVRLDADVRSALDRALERGQLTLRGYDRVLRLAWTMADLSGVDKPGRDELGRALFLKKGLMA